MQNHCTRSATSSLKANAQAVYSNLSDGAHGHLALVLSDAQYALITAQPFIRPVFPGPLAIPAGTTAPMALVLKEAHQENIRIFREVQGVEKALIQQIVQAVEAPYLASIRDRTSNSLRGTVYAILAHLQGMYGRVSPQMLEDRDNELRSMVYNTQLPIDTVFNAVEDYVDFAFLGDQALSVSQTIAKAYVIRTTSPNGIVDLKPKRPGTISKLIFGVLIKNFARQQMSHLKTPNYNATMRILYNKSSMAYSP